MSRKTPGPFTASLDIYLSDASVQVECFRQARQARCQERVDDYVELLADLIDASRTRHQLVDRVLLVSGPMRS